MTRIEEMKQGDVITAKLVEEDHFHVPYEHLNTWQKKILGDVIYTITGRRPDDRWAYFEAVKE